jgi:cell division protein FtsW
MKYKSKLIYYVFSLSIIGLFFISISSLSEALAIGDKFFFLKKQSLWLLVSSIFFLIGSRINLNFLKKNSFNFYILANILLAIVLIPSLGNKALGARRWLSLGSIGGIQPSEIFKLSAILFFPFLFCQENYRTIKNLLVYLGIPCLLILLEPNLSTTVLIAAIVLTVYYLSNADYKSILSFTLISIAFFGLMSIAQPYRKARIQTLLNPDKNKTTSSYHSNQILYALSGGGLFGKGFANSNQKYKYLPKISTDSILAIIGEETGFVGITFIITLYLILILYLFKLSSQIKDNYQSLLVASVACWITYQSLINIGAIAAIIPLTGIPLPFISYGGSSLTSLFFSIGLVVNIEKSNQNLLNSLNDTKNSSHRNTPNTSPRIHKTTQTR